jgi:hypothetical protein
MRRRILDDCGINPSELYFSVGSERVTARWPIVTAGVLAESDMESVFSRE